MIWHSEYFYGNKISPYGLERGYVDYATLSKAFDAVLNNEIYAWAEERGAYWEMVSGFNNDGEEEDYSEEIYQWYIVSANAVDILEMADQIVYYNEALDMYLWGVTHWGTSWDYVLTDIKIELREEK